MERSFDPRDLVMLPVLDASSAAALGQKLMTRAKKEELPAAVALSYRRLKEALAALRTAVSARLEQEPRANADRRRAHNEEGAAFSAMHDWLGAWTSVPEEFGGKKTREAKRVVAALFGDGLKFLQLSYDAGWTEADDRLRWLHEHEGEEVFAELGGVELLQNLRAAHKRYGEVLGITKEQAAPESTSIRAPLATFCDRLRDYVVQVAADANAGGDESREAARRLLAPLAHWQPRRASRDHQETPEAPPATGAPTLPPPAGPSVG